MTRWLNLVLLGWGLSFSLSPAAEAPKLGDADDAFQKRHYADALKTYQGLRDAADDDTRLKARFRAVEAQALLFRYGEAAADVFGQPLPADPRWHARFELLRAQVARAYVVQYGDNVPADSTRGATDPTKWTAEEWAQKIDDAFFDLHAQREALLERPLSDESYFINTEGRDLEAVPTLWDFVVQEWTDYLLREKAQPAGEARPGAEAFLDDSFSIGIRPGAPRALLAASLWEEAAQSKGEARELAREFDRAERFLLPLHHPDAVSTAPEHTLAERSLTQLFGQLRTPRARARVGWQLAQQWNSDEKFSEALTVCESIAGTRPATYETQACQQLAAQIRQPEMGLEIESAAAQSGGGISVRARNARNAYVRVYPTTLEDLRKTGQTRDGDYNFLRRLNNKQLSDFLAGKPAHRLSASIQEKAPYARTLQTIELPKLESGFYAVLVSNREDFRGKEAVVEGGLLNVSDLFLFGDVSPGEAKDRAAFHLYTLDGKTGAPVAGARIDSVQRTAWNKVESAHGQADDDGRLTVSVGKQHANDYAPNLDPLATRGSDHAFWPSPQSYYPAQEAAYDVYVDTDRGIYRPGQTVQGKVTVVRRNPRQVHANGGSVQIEARDASGERFHRVTVKLGAMGSAVFSLTLPKGRMLGRYSLSAQLLRQPGVNGQTGFSVEEYLRPTFETTLDVAARPWKYGQTARVTGHARYYFGGPVVDAPVQYRVYREPMIPYFCWWWSWRRPGARVEVAHGEARTAADGSFTVEVLPQADDPAEKDPLPARFVVETDARDAGGRTVTGTRTYFAGKAALLYRVTPANRFFFAGEPGRVRLAAVTLDGEETGATIGYRLLRLGPSSFAMRGLNTPTLDEQYRDTADGEKIAAGKVKTTAAKQTDVLLPPLPAGVYRLRLEGDDGSGGEVQQSVILISLGSVRDPGLDVPAVSVTEKDSYAPGDRARVLVGSPRLVGGGWWQIWRGGDLLQTKRLGPGVQLLTLPIGKDDQGGLTVRWFGVYQHQILGGTSSVEVPWHSPVLKLTVHGPSKVAPGARATWQIEARDAQGKPVDGEATVRVYDRSLDALAEAPALWGSSLYARHSGPPSLEASFGASSATGLLYPNLSPEYQPVRNYLPPELRLQGSRIRRRAYRFARDDSRDEEESFGDGGMAPMLADAPASAGMAMAKKSQALDAAPAQPPSAEPSAPGATPTRQDFSESALFAPQVKLVKGHGTVSTKMPDSLTSWTVATQTLTAEAHYGIDRGEMATRKDLMVRLEQPRFAREGDAVTVKTLIDNTSDHAVSGKVTVQLSPEGAAAKWGLKAITKYFKLDAGKQAALSWPLQAPEGDGAVRVRAVASSEGLSDAEERELPLLPAWQRIVTSKIASLDGGQSAELKVELPADAKTERAVLQIDANTALAILAALPGLVETPFNDAEALIDRYAPLAITRAVFQKYPALAAAVKKIPKHAGPMAGWDKDDPRRQLQLLESPWTAVADPKAEPYLNLLEPETVARSIQATLEKLRALQLSNGAFPWFAHGPADVYFTLYVLHGFAEAARFGVAPPQPLVDRALGYLQGAIGSELHPETASLSLALYAAYTVTALPTPAARKMAGDAKKWLDYAVSQPDALTPFGKAYAAHVFYALGDRKNADEYLDRALDGAREDALTGVYWAPEKQSWLWYEDSIDKHAFFMQTLAQWRPKDTRLPGLVKWLLFNRKASQWRSARASASAIYALLDFLEARGGLDKAEDFHWTWNGERGDYRAQPTEWHDKPARWVREGAKLAGGAGTAQVKKQGPGIAFASLTALYRSRQVAASAGGPQAPLEIDRQLFRRVRDGSKFSLERLKDGETVKVGDEIEVQLVAKANAAVEYVHLRSPRGAGFEPETTASGWSWDPLTRYEEPRDSLDQFFLPRLPTGEYVLRYRLRATLPGNYTLGAATLQSLYAPDLTANAATVRLKVE